MPACDGTSAFSPARTGMSNCNKFNTRICCRALLRCQRCGISFCHLNFAPNSEKCAAQVEANAADYRRYLEALTDDMLDFVITYRNSKGIEFSNSVGDTLTHVSLHGSYHRGQIAQTIRGAGLRAGQY